MMKTTRILVIIISLIMFSSLEAQIGGTQAYRTKQNYQTNYVRKATETKSIYSTDSTLVITSRVLLNKTAEFYVITIGVNNTAKTVKEANQITNSKIEKVINNVKKLGVSEDNFYVDFISETKMYDHRISEKEINEYLEGYCVRKNLIIKINKLSSIDKIIDYCSEQEIYDIIKVDYRSENLEKINKELFDEAIKVSESKLKRFSTNSSVKLTNKHRIVSESFNVFNPKNLYKQYNEAFETSSVEKYYNSRLTQKEVRKERSFFYDGVDTEIGVDKIIDDISPIIGIQYVYELVISYDLEK